MPIDINRLYSRNRWLHTVIQVHGFRPNVSSLVGIPVFIVHSQVLKTFLLVFSELFHAMGANFLRQSYFRETLLWLRHRVPRLRSDIFNVLPLR